MPRRGCSEPEPSDPLYFKSLKDLDDIKATTRQSYDGIVKFTPRKTGQTTSKGKLLVCHDYKGGYTESSFSQSYTFNYWFMCDIFVYFSHHRITIPPPGWISAAHRQGVKMLGTLIFEGGAEEDCLRIIVGNLPSSKTGQAGSSTARTTLPITPHYARVLAQLAQDRGFDGYLLNFECPLVGSFEQTRALAAWITLFQNELRDRVGQHAEVIWYDSVIVSGQLAWQDRLNNMNLPFFLSSTGFFTNYTWFNTYPALTTQFFTSIPPNLLTSPSQHSPKSLSDIYVGIDTWGRGTHGGGGFGSYRALDHISPNSLGLSVAVFGQAWTWETEQDKEGWDWDAWWEYDSALWLGINPSTQIKGSSAASTTPGRRRIPIQIPEEKRKRGEIECIPSHGELKPLKAYFTHNLQAPPNPLSLIFYTTFSPGIGVGWFVQGVQVFTSTSGGGWTDVDKQTCIGSALWPYPVLSWTDPSLSEDENGNPLLLPITKSAFNFADAWNGGNSIQIDLLHGKRSAGAENELGVFKSLWMPIQRIALTIGKVYTASVVYKVLQVEDGADVDVGLTMKSCDDGKESFMCDVEESHAQDLAHGWTKLVIRFTISAEADLPLMSAPDTDVELDTGLVLAILTSPSPPSEVTPSSPIFSFLVGELAIFPHLQKEWREDESLILWADWTPSESESDTASSTKTKTKNSDSDHLSGTLTWQPACALPQVIFSSPSYSEHPKCAWNVQPTISWFPRFVYFNIYALPFLSPLGSGDLDAGNALWIGTSGSGWDGRKFAFEVRRDSLLDVFGKEKETGNSKVRLYVQGVLESGEVMNWERCAFMDVDVNIDIVEHLA